MSVALWYTSVPSPLSCRPPRVFRNDQTRHHTFVLRAFVERPAGVGDPPVWRGTIRHLPGDGVRSVKSLEEVTEFIAGYLPDDLEVLEESD